MRRIAAASSKRDYVRAIIGAHQREQAARCQSQIERTQKITCIREALTADELTVIEVADLIGVTRKAVYKMLAADL